jgi:hypothetical protein
LMGTTRLSLVDIAWCAKTAPRADARKSAYCRRLTRPVPRGPRPDLTAQDTPRLRPLNRGDPIGMLPGSTRCLGCRTDVNSVVTHRRGQKQILRNAQRATRVRQSPEETADPN